VGIDLDEIAEVGVVAPGVAQQAPNAPITEIVA
jgi:hypothetical protein